MSKNYRENVAMGDSRDFGESVIETVLDWIEGNLKPNEVFSADDLILWMRNNYSPEDIFTYDQLVKWAEDNLDTE